MDMAAILVMFPGSFDQIVVTPSQGGSILTLTGPVVSEKKTFEECGRRRQRRRTTEACLSNQLTDEPLGWAKIGLCITNSIVHIM